MIITGENKFDFIIDKIQASGLRYKLEDSETNDASIMEKINQNKKLAFIMKRLPITYLKKLEFKHKSIDYPVKFIDDDLFVVFFGLAIPKNSIFYKLFRDGVQRLFEAGITRIFPGQDFYDNKEQIFKVFDRDNHDGVVLTCKLLDACFYLWLGYVAISILVFIVELIVFRLTKGRRNQVEVQRSTTWTE